MSMYNQVCVITFQIEEGCTEVLQSTPCHVCPAFSIAAQRRMPHAAAP